MVIELSSGPFLALEIDHSSGSTYKNFRDLCGPIDPVSALLSNFFKLFLIVFNCFQFYFDCFCRKWHVKSVQRRYEPNLV